MKGLEVPIMKSFKIEISKVENSYGQKVKTSEDFELKASTIQKMKSSEF